MFKINYDLYPEKRFDMAKFMPFAEGFDMLDSTLISQILSMPAVGNYTIRVEEKRPDLLSWNLYKDTQYWWILLIFNNFSTPDELTLGKEVRYFSANDLENIYFSLNSVIKFISN